MFSLPGQRIMQFIGMVAVAELEAAGNGGCLSNAPGRARL